MNRLLPFLAFVCSLAAGLGGCANRAVITSAMQRAELNSDLLAKEQAKTSDVLAKSLRENQQLVQMLATMITADCTRSNQGIATYVQARKDATSYRLKTQFDDAAYGVLDEFTNRFNEQFGPLDAKTAQVGKELAALDTPEFANDMGHAVKVSEKKREMMGNALFLASSNVRLRDKLIERIGTQRSQFFALIDARIAAIQAPSEDCGTVSKEFVEISAQLEQRVKAASDHQSAVAELYSAQHAELDVLMQYANRLAFYKLIIAGASGAVTEKVNSLSDRLTEAVAGGDVELTALLDHAQSHLVAAVDKFSGNLNGTATSLQSDLAAAVNRTRGTTSGTPASGKQTASNP